MWLDKLPWFSQRDRPIGIDVGPDRVRMLQMQQLPGGKLAVVAACDRSIPTTSEGSSVSESIAAAAEVIRQALEVGGFTRRHAIVSIPDAMVKIRTIRVAEEAVDTLLDTPELRAAFPFKINEAALRIFDAGLVGSGERRANEIIAAATPMELVQSWSAALSRAGAKVVSLQVRPWALFTGWLRASTLTADASGQQATHALLEIGPLQSQLVMARGSRITFVRTINLGSHLLDEAVARKVGATPQEARKLQARLSAEPGDDASNPVRHAVFDAVRGPLEELATDVARCLRYHSVMFRGARPACLTLCGDGARDPHLQRVFAPIISIPSEPAQGFGDIDVIRMKPVDMTGGIADWAVPLGLSMGEQGLSQTQPKAA